LRQMYVYHEYYKAKRVALIYPSSIGKTHEIIGSYFRTPSKTEHNEIENICSVISLKTEIDIHKWQVHICESVYKFCMSATDTENQPDESK
jgi:5-methylcytosine-specific restriction enzyme subunit McrC